MKRRKKPGPSRTTIQKISVIVPARDEEAMIGGCLEAIRAAAGKVRVPVETVVVLNRCRDATEEIALRYGAMLVRDDSRCIAAIRNIGVWHSTGDVVVTCDADSRLHPSTLVQVVAELEAGAVGGGVDVHIERRSPGIVATEMLFRCAAFLGGVSAGAFWTTRRTFEQLGGFDETRIVAEDVEFARRLRAWGKEHEMPFRSLWSATLSTSARKFDRFGDWCVFRLMFLHPLRLWRAIRSSDRSLADEYFYDFDHGAHPSKMNHHGSSM